MTTRPPDITIPTPSTVVPASAAPQPANPTTTATVEEAPPIEEIAADADGIAWVPAVVVVMIVAALAIGITWALMRARRPAAPSPAPPPPAPRPPVPVVDRDRDALVDALIEARDSMDPQVVHAQRVGLALDRVGVRDVDPTGDPFDPARHQQVDTLITTDPALDGVVALVSRMGYAEGGRLRRFPQVVVYRRLPSEQVAR